MLNYCRAAAGLIAVWAVFLGILTLWPHAPSAFATGLQHERSGAGDRPDTTPTATYIHTGLWVADVQADGTVVYLRGIRRR